METDEGKMSMKMDGRRNREKKKLRRKMKTKGMFVWDSNEGSIKFEFLCL